MPWRPRRGGRCYFYERRREGGRVRSVCIGSCRLAGLVTERLAIRREARETDRRMARARRQAEASGERASDDLLELFLELAEWAPPSPDTDGLQAGWTVRDIIRGHCTYCPCRPPEDPGSIPRNRPGLRYSPRRAPTGDNQKSTGRQNVQGEDIYRISLARAA